MGAKNVMFDEHLAAVTDCIETQRRTKSLRRICSDAGLPESDAAMLSRIVRGKHVPDHTLRRIGHALGVTPPPRIEVDPCPDCGSVHTGRCHGKPVEMRPVRQHRPYTRWADAPVSVLAAAIRGRVDY